MKNFSGSKWALMLAGVFAAAAMDSPDSPSSRPEPAGPTVPVRKQAARHMEVMHTSLQTVIVLPVIGAKAGGCEGPLKADIKKACLEGRSTRIPAVELARNTGTLLSRGKEGAGLIAGVLQGLYPSSKERAADKKKEKAPSAP